LTLPEVRHGDFTILNGDACKRHNLGDHSNADLAADTCDGPPSTIQHVCARKWAASMPPLGHSHIFGVSTSFSILSFRNFALRPILTSPISTFFALQIERQRSSVRDEQRSHAHTSSLVISGSATASPLDSAFAVLLVLNLWCRRHARAPHASYSGSWVTLFS
jgi:hypothetical protein